MGLQVIFELINSLVDRSNDFDDTDEEEEDEADDKDDDEEGGKLSARPARPARVLKLGKEHADLVCERITKCVVKNICLDFCPLVILKLS